MLKSSSLNKPYFSFLNVLFVSFSRLESVKFMLQGPNMVYFSHIMPPFIKIKINPVKIHLYHFGMLSLLCHLNPFSRMEFHRVNMNVSCSDFTDIHGQFILVSGKIYFTRVSYSKTLKTLLNTMYGNAI